MYRDPAQRDFARQLRKAPTDAERRLWHYLRAGKLGVKFRRQAAIGAYIVDFVCFARKLVVELDGPQHLLETAKTHDALRSAWLASRGFRVIRFRNQELDDDPWQVVRAIQKALQEAQPPPQPSPQGGGSQTGESGVSPQGGGSQTGESGVSPQGKGSQTGESGMSPQGKGSQTGESGVSPQGGGSQTGE